MTQLKIYLYFEGKLEQMKQKLSKKSVALTVTFALLLMALVFPVATAATALITRTINAQFGVNITINDLPFTPKDSNEKEVQAMVVDGTTYLPVRALGEATGSTVKWDGETNTVKLYTSGNGEWISVDNAFYSMMNADRHTKKIEESRFNFTSDVGKLKNDSKQDYKTGFLYTGEHMRDLAGSGIWIVTERKYNTIQFSISLIQDNTDTMPISMSVVDSKTGIVYKTCAIEKDVQVIEADISGAEKISIDFDSEWSSDEETRQITIGDMKLR